ncbi:PilW family protein [Legionella clemsonensis]|uniref:Tfp pilus assembly protein PilW n=1 Tax=Legionella clemsonensis TaxID=1867846 RepID=A0A222P404_9GAMM|nr:hypothetical protein [Legionella clemsonensis]ASQ46562.1 hypothetical protein clem_10065 [Legionella clemsonensis]
MSKYSGLSLIEMMLSLFLATVLIALLTGQYLIVKQHYYRLQDLLDYALELDWIEDLIRNSVHGAGFTPCVGLNWLKTLDGRTGKKLAVIEVKQSGSLATYRMSEQFDSVLRYDTNSVVITGNHLYKKNQTVLIADCFHAEVRTIATIQRRKSEKIITLKTPIIFDYVEPIYLGEWIEEHFFIQKNSAGKEALYYQRGRAEELTPIVKNLSATLHSGQKLIMQLLLTLTNGETVKIEAATRTP